MTTPPSGPRGQAPELQPPSRLTCPHCGSGLPEQPGLSHCTACGTRLAGPPTPSPLALPPQQGTGEQPAAADAPAGGGGGMALLDTRLPREETPGERCPECGGTFDGDGYCTQCGAARPDPRHHMESRPTDWVAAVCDRGVRRADNQDAMAVSAHDGTAALVVCDGVSTAPRSSEASLEAAQAALDVLTTSTSTGIGLPTALEGALVARLEAAADAAAAAVEEVAAQVTSADVSGRVRSAAPSCTMVAGVVEEGLLVVGSVGDSRAYWCPDAAEPRLLTTDDSIAQEQVSAGVERAVAEQGPMAHTITRWLGPDSPDHTPVTTAVPLQGSGWVLLCSDGLWNYASEPRELARQLAAAVEDDPDPLAVARTLVRWAKEQGGHDNVTVALARVGAAAAPGSGENGDHG